MAKHTPTAVIDVFLDKIATATEMILCSAEPSTYAEATATYDLADQVMASGDFAKAADTAGTGRKLTVAQKSGVTVDASGTATHVALCDATALLYVTTCTSQAVTAGNTVTFNSWAITLPQPT